LTIAPTIKLIAASVMLMAAFAVTANADVINVTGSSQGNFNGGTTASNVGLGSSILGGPALEFQGQGFTTPVTTGLPAVQVTVGAFDLHTFSAFNFGGDTFNLVVTFTAPPGAPGGPQTFTATLSGTVQILAFNDAISIDFNNTPQVFSYTGGTFSFSVLDIPELKETDGFVALRANISATAVAQTAEPVSMILLGSGLTGVAAGLRWRRKVKLVDSN
jgi:hypothetical protein